MKYQDNGQWYDITTKVLDGVPIGSQVVWAGSFSHVPDGWLICNGSAVSRTKYADLFSVIGTTYGSGDGSTTFNVPSVTGRIIKAKMVVPVLGNVLNEASSDNTKDTYSCYYIGTMLSSIIDSINARKSIISARKATDLSLNATGYAKINLDTLIAQSGDTTKLVLGSNKITIGEGVSKVLVSAQCVTQGPNTTKNLVIYKNGSERLISMNSRLAASNESSFNRSLTITPQLVSVSQGDYFELYFYGSDGDSVSMGGSDNRTYITIEVVE